MAGPLLDRIDLWSRLSPITASTRKSHRPESSAVVRARVQQARAAAAHRWASHGWATNAEVPGPELQSGRFVLPRTALRPLDTALRAGELTVRGAHHVLRVAWTLADLAGRDRPDADMVAVALGLRRIRPACCGSEDCRG